MNAERSKLSDVPVVRAPRLPDRDFFGIVAHAITSLWGGMKITFHYFARPSTVVTRQYPEHFPELFDRTRTQLSLIHDANGFHKCTACTFCEQACPNASIRVFERKAPATEKPELDYLIWKMGSCTYCNACVIACPFNVLTFQGNFESSVFDSRLLTYNLTRYAGPTTQVLMKVTDPAERLKMIEPRAIYSGPNTLGGRKAPSDEAVAFSAECAEIRAVAAAEKAARKASEAVAK